MLLLATGAAKAVCSTLQTECMFLLGEPNVLLGLELKNLTSLAGAIGRE